MMARPCSSFAVPLVNNPVLPLIGSAYLQLDLLWLYPQCRPSMKVLVPQSCPTLRNPMDYSPPGSFVHGILQARILEWVAMLSSRGSSRSRNQTWILCIAARLYDLSHQGLSPSSQGHRWTVPEKAHFFLKGLSSLLYFQARRVCYLLKGEEGSRCKLRGFRGVWKIKIHPDVPS